MRVVRSPHAHAALRGRRPRRAARALAGHRRRRHRRRRAEQRLRDLSRPARPAGARRRRRALSRRGGARARRRRGDAGRDRRRRRADPLHAAAPRPKPAPTRSPPPSAARRCTRATPTTCSAAAASFAATSTRRSPPPSHRASATLRDAPRRARLHRARGRLRRDRRRAPIASGAPLRRVRIFACTQTPYMDRDEVASVLQIAPEQVHIVPSAIGGGFGGKLDLSVQPLRRGRRLEARPRRAPRLRAPGVDAVEHQAPSGDDAGERRLRRATAASSPSTSPATSTPAPIRRGDRPSPTGCRSTPAARTASPTCAR